MYHYSNASLDIVGQLHPMFHKPLFDVIKVVDIKMLEGRRSEVRQDMLFSQNMTKVAYPDSAHNPLSDDDPVFAFDAMPYTKGFPGGVDWRSDKELFEAIARGDEDEARAILENIKRIRHTAGVIIGVFHSHGIPIINGADWDGDNRFDDHSFSDSPHYQHRDWRALRDEL